MPQSFDCPNCSAPLDLAGIVPPTMRCPYCHTSMIIPEELRRQRPGTPAIPVLKVDYSLTAPADFDEKLDFIKEKALAGNKIEAIKAVRETFDLGLKQAVDLVEAMQRDDQVDYRLIKLLAPQATHTARLDAEGMQQIVDRIKSGDKIEAIKLFRERTGVGLKDAKQTIDGMEVAISASPEGESAAPSLGMTYTTVSQVTSAKRNGPWLGAAFVILIILVVVVPLFIGLSSPGGPLAGTWARINPFALGRLSLTFGKEGTGPGYFTDARYIAVDNNGHIFVSEFNGGKVQVFDENGNYLTQWKATGEAMGDIYLSGMAAGRNGAVYAVIGGQLYVYDGLTGSLLGRLDHPDGWGFTDVTVAPDGSVVAAWYKNQDDIVRFDEAGQVDLVMQNAIGDVTQDSEMDMRVAVDGSGNIYALAYFNQGVYIFSPDGRYISRFGSMGDESGQFTSPRSIAVDNLGRIFIADFPGVMVYTSDGRYLDTLSVEGAVMGMTFDDQNNLYLVAGERVLCYKLK